MVYLATLGQFLASVGQILVVSAFVGDTFGTLST